MLTIESKNNNLYKELKKLKEKKHRTQKEQFIIEGLRFVDEALKCNVSLEYLIFTENFLLKEETFIQSFGSNVKKILLSDTLFNQLSSTENPQGILAVANMQNKSFKEGEFVILIDKVQDPGNMGTIIRTAHAAGASGIVVTKGTVDVYNDKTLRSTMGSIFYMPIIEDDNLKIIKNLKNQGYKLVVSSLQGEKNFFEEDLKDKVIFAVGNEGNGISDEIYEISDIKVKIPMPGNAESLNVAVATSIMIYEKIRQNIIK